MSYFVPDDFKAFKSLAKDPSPAYINPQRPLWTLAKVSKGFSEACKIQEKTSIEALKLPSSGISNSTGKVSRTPS